MNKTATVIHIQTRKQRRLAARRSRRPAAQGAPHFRLKPLTALIRATLPVTLLGLPAASLAGPEGGVVTAGSGTVARPDAQTTNIQQHSQNLILNWDSYNVQANEAVNYRQPNANAQALNRILDHNPSQIFGQINANGKVLLVNPNGVFFKPGARVNVGGLVASGLNISDKDFLAGKYHFAHDGKGAPGAVINQGLIQAATGGAVSLIGGAVKNEGTILAHAGQVNLVAGRAMAMDFDGDGLIQFAVTEELLERAEGLEAAVSNTGTIKAEGGAVLLKGRAARDVFTQVVNNSGVIGAGRVESSGGVIRLVAEGPGSSLLNTGTLNAASEKGAGGTVKLKAEGKVAVSGKARITAASRTGNGGRIDISGGDVAVSGQALITAASGVAAVSGTGQAQTGNALLDVDSSFRRAAPGVLPSRRIQGILPINDSEGADSKGLAANKKPRHSSESWNPGKTTHSGPGRNDLSNLAGGTIHIKAKNKAVISGNAQITAVSETGKGGHIQITGDKVGLMGLARLDASGAAGGGEILLGGDYKGQNAKVKNAKVTYVGKGARLSADAKTKGKGGRVIVWADDTTRYHGRISARGGPKGGDGGFVEVSGKRYLAFRGKVDLNAPKGRAGTLLLDPNDLCIGGNASCGGGGTPEDTNADSDNNFNAASDTANSWVSQTTLTNVGNANIILRANRDVFFDSNISLGTGFTSSLQISAGRDIDMKTRSLTLGGNSAEVRFEAGRNISVNTISVANGNVYLAANGAVTQTGVITAGELHLNRGLFSGTYTLTQNNAINSLWVHGGVSSDSSGNVSFRDDAGFQIGRQINTSAGRTITLRSNGAITQAPAGTLEGAGRLVKQGTGTLTLSQRNNQFTGRLQIEAGTVNLTHSANLALERGIVDFQNSGAATATLTHSNNQTIGGLSGGNANSSVEIRRNATLTINNASTTNTTFSGVLKDSAGAGAGNLTIAGQGMLTLGGTNTYTGRITIKGWTGPASTPDSERNGSRLTVLTGFNFAAGAAGGQITVENYGSLILRNLTYFVRNPLNLRGPGAWSDPNPATSGRQRLGALQKTGNTSEVRIENPITLSGNATIRNVSSQELKLSMGSNVGSNVILNLGAYNLTLDVVGSGAIRFRPLIRSLGTSGFEGSIEVRGSGSLIKTGSGPLIIPSGGNTLFRHTGNTEINGGSLIIETPATTNRFIRNTLNNSSKLVVNGGTLDIRTNNYTIGSLLLRGNGRIIATGADASQGRLTLASGNFNLQEGTVSAKLAGTGAGLTKTSTGLVTLSGANSYTGATNVNAGELRLANNAALGSSNLTTVNAGGTLNLTGGLNISGRALRLNGGTLGSVSGANSWTGDITLGTAGTSGAVGGILRAASGSLTVGALGSVLNLGATAASPRNLKVLGAGNVSILANLTGFGKLTKGEDATDTGTLNLGGSPNGHTYRGDTEVKAGTLTTAGDDRLSDNSRLVVEGGTVDLGRNNDTVAGVLLRSGSITRDAAGGNTEGRLTVVKPPTRTGETLEGLGEFSVRSGTISAILRGTNINLIKRAGTDTSGVTGGTVTLSYTGAHPLSGSVRILAGRLIIRGTITGGILEVNGAYDLAGVTQTWAGLRLISGNITDSGRLNGGRTEYGALIVNSSVTVGLGKFDLQRGTVSAKLSGSGALEKNQVSNTVDGKVTLSNAGNDYSGTTTINKGTLAITDSGALGNATSAITVNSGGTLALEPAGGASLTLNRALNLVGGVLASLSGANNIWSGAINLQGDDANVVNTIRSASGSKLTVSGDLSLQFGTPTATARNLTIEGAGDVVLSGIISGLGGLIKDGAGRLTLSGTGDNTYAGDTTVNAGYLTVSKNSALGNAPGNVASKTIVKAGASLELAAPTTGASAGRLTIPTTENLELAGDGVLSDSADPASGIGALRSVRGNNTVNGAITLTANVRIYSDRVITTALPATLPDPNNSLTLAGIISGATFGLEKLGPGKLTLTSLNTYTGRTKIDEGELELNNADGTNEVLHDESDVDLADGPAKLTVIRNETIGTLSGGGAAGGNIEIRSGTLTVKQKAGNEQYSGIISGAGNLKKTGPGTLGLGGRNTYTGTTEVNQGTLTITNSAALGPSTGGAVTVNAPTAGRGSTTLELSGGVNVNKTLTLNGGRVGLGRLARLVSTDVNNTWSGLITVSGHVIFRSETASDTLTITGGIGSGAAADANELIMSGLGNITINTGAITGAGSIVRQDNGVLELGGANTGYTGNITVTEGTLRVTHNNALGTTAGHTTLGNGAILELQAASASDSLNIGETLRLSGGTATLRNARGINTWSGRIRYGRFSDKTLTIDNRQAAAADGAPTLTLSNNIDRYQTTSGESTLNITVNGGGHTRLSGTLDIRRGILTKNDGGKLTLNNGSASASAPALRNFLRANVTAGTLRLEGGDALYNAAAVILGSTARLEIAGNETIGALSGGGRVNIENNRRLTVNQTRSTTYNGIIEGANAAGLSKTGTGTLTLGGANTYAGTTLVERGTLAVSDSSGLGLSTGGATNGTIVSNGATLALSSATSINVGEALTLNAGGTLGNLNGDNTYSGRITLKGTATNTDHYIKSDTGSRLNVTLGLSLEEVVSRVTQTRNLTVRGEGNVVLSGIISGAGDLIRGADSSDQPGRLTLSGAAPQRLHRHDQGRIRHAAYQQDRRAGRGGRRFRHGRHHRGPRGRGPGTGRRWHHRRRKPDPQRARHPRDHHRHRQRRAAQHQWQQYRQQQYYTLG